MDIVIPYPKEPKFIRMRVSRSGIGTYKMSPKQVIEESKNIGALTKGIRCPHEGAPDSQRWNKLSIRNNEEWRG